MNRLMRNSLCFVLGVFLALAVVPAFAGHTIRHATATTVHKIYDTTVERSCSAVMIAPGRALTAKHCADFINPVIEIDGVLYPYTVTAVSAASGADLAYLNVPGAPCPCADFSPAAAQEADKVIVIGFPYGMLRVVTYGEAQGRIDIPPGQQMYPGTYLVITAPAAPGNSGGGVFNENGELIGITSGAASHLTLVAETPTLR